MNILARTLLLLTALAVVAPAGATITAVQEGGVTTDNAASTAYTFASNVTSGNLVVAVVTKYVPAAADVCVAGDLTKTAGTSTIGTVSVDVTANVGRDGTSTDVIHTCVFSVLVTGTGSLTLTVTAPSGTYWTSGFGEYAATGGWDGSRLEDTASDASGTDGTTSIVTGNMTSAGGALFIGGLDVYQDTNSAITPDAAFTTIFEQEDGTAHATGSAIRRIVSTGTTDSLDWTLADSGNSAHAEASAVYKEVASGSAATLSSPTPSGTLGTSTTATIGATTDDSSGTTFYAVVDTDSLTGITATQVKAAQDAGGGAVVASCNASVSTTSPSCGVTGLTASTAYNYAAVQNSAGGDSNVVTGSFTTAAPAGAAAPVFIHHLNQQTVH